MELELLNSSFQRVYILDTFVSMIWTDRFWEMGDFDLTTLPTTNNLNMFNNASYLRLKESDHLMIIEHKEIKSDIENGDLLVIKGRSLESILERRIIWEPTYLSGSMQDGIESLIIDAIQYPDDPDRTISNFTVDLSSDSAITSLTVDTQFGDGETLYKAISEMCQAKEVGFRIILDSNNNFEFGLYAGTDRSVSQSTNVLVEFSSNLDNLLEASYVETNKYLKTVVLVAGEQGVGNAKAYVEVDAPGTPPTGLNRREMYYKANISRNLPGGGTLTDAQYLDQLEGKGIEELAKNVFVESFDGEVSTVMYNYGEDFFMGDVLQIADDYGHSTSSRVTEMIYSQNVEGIKVYPTFTTTGN